LGRRFSRCYLCGLLFLASIAQPNPFREQYADGNDEYNNNQAIEPAAGLRCYRFRAIDVALSLEAFGRLLEGPCKDKRERESHGRQ
jgi:hypothetical protein